ncbi:MAG: hypothetical protein AB7O28_25390 [Vicinamibacterales bacterium]
MREAIQDAPFGVFLAMVGVPLAMALVAVIAGLNARRQARVVSTTKAVPIGMAEDGYRLFEGTVEAIDGETVVAPLTQSPCVWYAATVEEWTLDARGDTRKSDWKVVKTVTSSAPLLIRDRTGACVVRLFGAEMTPTDKSRWTGGTLEPEDRNPPRVGRTESAEGMLRVAGGPNSRYRYSEERIYAGDPLMVTGAFESHRFDRGDADDLDELPPDPAIAGADWAPEEDDGDDTSSPAAAVTGSHGRMARHDWDAADIERHDTLTRRAAAITKAEIQKGGKGQPLIVAATTAATHAAMSEMGAQAAFMVALVPLGIAALVLLARFG